MKLVDNKYVKPYQLKDIDQNDLFLVGDSRLDKIGLIAHHIESTNDFYQNGVHQIITQVFKIEKNIENKRASSTEDREIDRIYIEVKFTDVKLYKPQIMSYFSHNKTSPLYPQTALLNEKNYSGDVRVDAEIKATAYLKNGGTREREDSISKLKICKLPIMTRSVLCNTTDNKGRLISKEQLLRLKEDPFDFGGCFPIKGVEWVIDNVENVLYNDPRIFINIGHEKEVMRCEFISKPGDAYQNSDMIIIRFLDNNNITCEVVRDKLKDIKIPFYVLYRALGWSTDKDIFSSIIYSDDPTRDDVTKKISNKLKLAMNSKYQHVDGTRFIQTQSEVLEYLARFLKNYREENYKHLDLDKVEQMKHAVDNLKKIFDIHFLPHVGMAPDARHKKLRFLSMMIRKMFLTMFEYLPQTDRDSIRTKRFLSTGPNYGKIFKTYFNASVVQQIKSKLAKDFKNTSFSKVDMAESVRSSIHGGDFERLVRQSITSGKRSELSITTRRKITNRLSSQIESQKNQLARASVLRQITAPTSQNQAKQTERANLMRRVQPSQIHYIDLVHSPEGEKVGINKQLSLFASITGASSSEVLKSILYKDPDIIPLDKVSSDDIGTMALSNIYVNGDWIGCTKSSRYILNKYRKMRRELKLPHPITTIYWDNLVDEIKFWVDVGRLDVPLLIVYNNKRDPEKFPPNERKEKAKFRQSLAITKNHIDLLYQKKIGIDDLLKEGVIEYITAEEQENCWVCPSLSQLKKDKENELKEYTHLAIPEMQMGLTGLVCPFANHNSAPRITFETNQAKQTCGYFALNWPFRADKDTFLQYVNETPMVRTVANKYLYPNGSNTMVAIMCYTG